MKCRKRSKLEIGCIKGLRGGDGSQGALVSGVSVLSPGFEAPGVRAVPSVRPLCGESLFQSWRQKNNPLPLRKDPTSVTARLRWPLLVALEQYRRQIFTNCHFCGTLSSLAVRVWPR